VLSGTVLLYPNTRFFGLPGGFSQILAPSWNPNGKVSFLVQVADATHDPAGASAGRAIMSDIYFNLPTKGTAAASALDQSYIAALDWQAGARSIASQIYVSFQYNEGLGIKPPSRNVVQIDHGGGRWYGLQIGGDWGPNGADGYSFLVSNTSQPTSVYGANIEHAAGKSFYGFENASNVRILGTKAERGGAPHWFFLSSSHNVMISGISNHDPTINVTFGADSSNVNVNTTSIYAVNTLTNPRIVDAVHAYPYADNYALFKKGSFDDSAFVMR
jgi:hypothetical protein